MRYASAGAFRRALEMRLATQARDTGRSVVRLRKEVAFDRLVARLLGVATDRWVLKGALALDYHCSTPSSRTQFGPVAGTHSANAGHRPHRST